MVQCYEFFCGTRIRNIINSGSWDLSILWLVFGRDVVKSLVQRLKGYLTVINPKLFCLVLLCRAELNGQSKRKGQEDAKDCAHAYVSKATPFKSAWA